jgi:hypothetical protein
MQPAARPLAALLGGKALQTQLTATHSITGINSFSRCLTLAVFVACHTPECERTALPVPCHPTRSHLPNGYPSCIKNNDCLSE